MRVSQLLHVMDKGDEINIYDGSKKIGRWCIYSGTVRGIKKDDSVNKMRVVAIYPYDNKLLVLADA